nr:putative reverse transcriptase domain-containing protein [Tanacetum cinerariifolium]
MTPSSTSSDGVWPCPFRGFHCCPDGEVGNKEFPRLISLLQRLHLPSDECKGVLREAISTDHGLYMAVEETLKVFNQWLCGKSVDLHAVSRDCHHPDGLVRFSKGSDDMSGYIVGISKPFNKESGTEITKGLVFNAELLDLLCKVAAQPDAIDACVRLLLFPRCTLQVYRPKNRQERMSENRKSLQQSSILKSLAMWGKDDDITMLVYRPKNRQERMSENRKSLQQSSILKSLAMWGKDDDITMLVKSILHGFALGSFSQCGGDFLEEGATGNTNIKQCLRKVADGHFTAAVKVLSSFGVAPYCDDTIKALKAKHPYKPPPPMLSITFSEPPLVAETDSIFSHIKLFPKGTSCGRDGLRAQHVLDALCGEGSATATGLLKVITSVVNLWLARRCPPILAEFVASAPLTPFLKPDNKIRPIEASRLYIGDTHIWSATGVHQGDPLGPLLFALILHPLLHKTKDSCKLILHAWYLDDGTVIGDSKEVARVLDIKKRPSSGVKLLGRVVSRDANFISGLAMRRAVNSVDLMGLLPQLHDPQSELILLRSCMGIYKLFFGLKTCQPVHIEDATLFFEKDLRGSIENIVVCGGPFFGDLQWQLSSLHIRFDGLGLYSAKLVSSYTFVASRAQYWVLQDHILPDSGICGMDDDYVSAMACLRDTIPSFDVSGFTNKDTVPSKAQQTLANVFFSEIVKDMEVHFDMTMRHKAVEYRTILKYRLMIPLFPVDAICPVCRKTCLDSFGEHAVHCKELP